MFEEKIVQMNGVLKAAPNKKSYSVKEVQQILGVCRQTVYKLMKQKKFQSVHTNSGTRIIKSSFDAWLDSTM